jgi:hypothetical protein
MVPCFSSRRLPPKFVTPPECRFSLAISYIGGRRRGDEEKIKAAIHPLSEKRKPPASRAETTIRS